MQPAPNPALHAASATGRPLICLYIFEEESKSQRPLGGAARWWLHGALSALHESFGASGGELVLMRGAAADVIGYLEVETFADGERLSRHGGWAEIGNLHVTQPYRRRGVATWLLGQAADWLQLAQVDRILDYAWLDGQDPGGLDYAGYRAFLPTAGFRELTRTRRGWSRESGQRSAMLD